MTPSLPARRVANICEGRLPEGISIAPDFCGMGNPSGRRDGGGLRRLHEQDSRTSRNSDSRHSPPLDTFCLSDSIPLSLPLMLSQTYSLPRASRMPSPAAVSFTVLTTVNQCRSLPPACTRRYPPIMRRRRWSGTPVKTGTSVPGREGHERFPCEGSVTVCSGGRVGFSG